MRFSLLSVMDFIMFYRSSDLLIISNRISAYTAGLKNAKNVITSIIILIVINDVFTL